MFVKAHSHTIILFENLYLLLQFIASNQNFKFVKNYCVKYGYTTERIRYLISEYIIL